MRRFKDVKYFGVKLSPNRIRNDKGQLIVTGCTFARTGPQKYHKSELDIPYGPGEDEFIYINRPVEEVSHPATIASFEGAPLTNDHPSDDVKVGVNWDHLTKGMATNVRYVKGDEGNTKGYLVADLIFTDPQMIDAVENHRINELSAGYNCDVDETDWTQRKIRGNHIAVVESGRAGKVAYIRDKKYSEKKVKKVKKVKDNKTNILETLKKEILYVMGGFGENKVPRNRKKDYENVLESITERKEFPGVYIVHPSFGMTLGERNDFAERLKKYDDLQFNFGPYFIVAHKDEEEDFKDKKVKVGDKSYKVIDSYTYELQDEVGETHKYTDLYAYNEDGIKIVAKTIKK